MERTLYRFRLPLILKHLLKILYFKGIYVFDNQLIKKIMGSENYFQDFIQLYLVYICAGPLK